MDIGGVEVEEATYSLGICGHIIFTISETYKKYKINQSVSNGWQKSEWLDSEEWGKSKKVTPQEIIDLLPKNYTWTYHKFICLWAGFADGYDRGFKKENIVNVIDDSEVSRKKIEEET